MPTTVVLPRAGRGRAPPAFRPTASASSYGSGTASPAVLRPAKRKKSRLSATQLQRQREHAADQSALYNLTLDVNDLRQQVRELEERRALHATRQLLARQRFQDQAVGAAALFFSVFRSGFRAFSARELAFLNAHVAPDVRFTSSLRGFDAFLDQWRRYKLLLRQRVFRISTIRVVASFDLEDNGHGDHSGDDAAAAMPRGCALECLGEFEAFLTREAIEVVFSHVAEDAALASRLEGARIVCPTRTRVVFDGRGRIVDYDAHADFFTALTRVQGLDPLDVIRVMASARIESQGSILPASQAPMSREDGSSADTDGAYSNANEEEEEEAARASRKRHSVAFILS